MIVEGLVAVAFRLLTLEGVGFGVGVGFGNMTLETVCASDLPEELIAVTLMS